MNLDRNVMSHMGKDFINISATKVYRAFSVLELYKRERITLAKLAEVM